MKRRGDNDNLNKMNSFYFLNELNASLPVPGRLKNKDTGADLRAAKKLLGLHKSLEKEKEMVNTKIENLLAEGKKLKAEKHFDEKGMKLDPLSF